MKPDTTGSRIHITGIVQGVGFRPFVYTAALRSGLAGWVRNTSAGVDIQVEGTPEAIGKFTSALKNDPPPLARIDTLDQVPCAPQGLRGFEILASASSPDDFLPISPDVSICADCLRELFDPADRRYRYPFINCTHCGPRFTIITDLPYDRPNTTMEEFPLCPECASEYHDPTNRRFHAQPVACPRCGPQVWLEPAGATDGAMQPGFPCGDLAISETQKLLANGKIVAVKGLGGFHLACDATNRQAVIELRRRKLRVDKPFAVMLPDLESVAQHCYLSSEESSLLEARERPIVILRRRSESIIAREVAPPQATRGGMLPYTPLHYLLLSTADPAILVMTSGNLSEEPIAIENQAARQRLSTLADAFLMHNRPIRTRCDDSVTRVFQANRQHSGVMLRRGRGYAPDSIRLPWESAPLLAVGPELKNTFCLARGPYAFLSHHIGDLENYETLQAFEDGIHHFERLFRIQPDALAYDLHPNYLATRYALERAESQGLPAIGVQHHHAHIAACMSENGLDGERPVIGVAFDGTGYGTDGAIWGGEFLLADYAGFQRLAHLAYIPLPGGDAATRAPWRTALAWLQHCGIDWAEDLWPVQHARRSTQSASDYLAALRHQLTTRLNAPLTSSMGRLFDAAACLVGVRQTVNYEAQAAIEFEALADGVENGAYPFAIDRQGENPADEAALSPLPYTFQINPEPVFNAILADLRHAVPAGIISARFHNGVAEMVKSMALAIRSATGITEIALSGGVWQNSVLFQNALKLLEQESFLVYTHRYTPPNDGGVALGQAVIASYRIKTNR